MADLLPPLDHVTLAQNLTRQPQEQPLPDLLVRRGWNALHAIATLLRVEDLVRSVPAGEVRAAHKASLPSLVANAELACRLFADATREVAREQ